MASEGEAGASSRGPETRDALLRAGLRQFGLHGFEAASLRDIVSDAGANISAVRYHFGSKAALHAAIVEEVIERAAATQAVQLIDALATLGPPDAQRALAMIARTFLTDAHNPERADLSRFLRREILIDGRGVDTFVEKVFDRQLTMIARLIASATGKPPDDPGLRLRAMAFIGQIVFLSTADTLLKAAFGWTDPLAHIDEMVAALYTPMEALGASR